MDITKDTQPDEPIVLMHDMAKELQPVKIRVQKGARAVVFEAFLAGETKDYTSASETAIEVEEGASLEHVQVHCHAAGASHTASTKVVQARDSQFRSFILTTGAKVFTNNFSLLLQGEGAEAWLNGLHALKGSSQAESKTFVDHAVPNAVSHQLYKCILDDTARSLFNGRILVRQEAQQTNSYQLNKNLLLSRECRADTKPELEIFADDVKCSHGATIGQLSEEELFYLETRGLGKKDAMKMLVQGFVNDVVGEIQNIGVREKVSEYLD